MNTNADKDEEATSLGITEGVNTMPPWVATPFRNVLDDIEELARLTSLSTKGISMVRAAPALFAAAAKATGKEDEERSAQLKELGDLAEREVSKGFPLIYGQGTISLWSVIEHFVKDFLIAWMMNEPSALQAEGVKKIKIPLSLYDTLSREERYYFVLETLERETQAAFKQGVSRFESLLNIFNLGGTVEDELRATLFEMSNVRNVLVHRRGTADRRLVDACPWLGLKVGEMVVVTPKAFGTYAKSLTKYSSTLLVRVSEHFKVELWQDESGEWHRRDIEDIKCN
jgi:hypothetical protein